MHFPTQFSQPVEGTEGYGQLSISTSALKTQPLSGDASGAAGVWALIGAPADVDKAKVGSPQDSAAVVAHSTDGHAAVIGDSQAGVGVAGISHNAKTAAVSGSNPGGLAGSFDGNIVVEGIGSFYTITASASATFNTITSNSDITVKGGINLSGIITIASNGDIQFADCAEQFDIVAETPVDPGTVMIVGESEALSPCDRPYDTRVAGVVSGAEQYRPALILDQRDTGSPRMPIALMGKVYCKVDAGYGAIAAGDLLTTSPTAGHAMKASDPSKSFGTTIGKALRSWPDGKGLIPVLVALS
jgi:hypothetical protein